SPDKPYSITELTSLVKTLLESESGLQDVWVAGEVSNLTRHGSGHVYFSLKDENSQMRAVMFRGHAQDGAAEMEEGMMVQALGSVGVYEKRGEYQLYVRRVRPAGLGALFVKFEELKKKLAAEGLFDAERKKPLPEFPWKMAVCTSPTGAAVRDVLNVIERRFPAVEVVIVPAIVQGGEAPASIVGALERADALPGVSVILLVRGGGSLEDLWGFNDERVARAIARCRTPVVSGVGHETDFTIADFTADVRAPTPSAAAEIAVPSMEEVADRIRSERSALVRAARGRVELRGARVEALYARVAPARLLDRVRQLRQQIDERVAGASRGIRRRVEGSMREVAKLRGHLEALDPRKVLGRGYALCYDAETERLIRSVGDVKPARRLRTVVADGSFFSIAEGGRARGGKERGRAQTGSLFDEED
ncbi:MAG: exodeoxyribonuclease VII large subunit, partial [bacterium]